MLTRSQTQTINNFFQVVEEDVCRKTMLLRGKTVTAPTKVSKPCPQNLFTIMRTRSQSKLIDRANSQFERKRVATDDTYAVDIDFDGASREWQKNKRSLGNGTYEYK